MVPIARGANSSRITVVPIARGANSYPKFLHFGQGVFRVHFLLKFVLKSDTKPILTTLGSLGPFLGAILAGCLLERLELEIRILAAIL